MRLAVRRKINQTSQRQKQLAPSVHHSKAKLQRVIVGAAFVQLIILRFREWDISRFDLCPIFVFISKHFTRIF